MSALEVRGVTRSFGAVRALDDVSFRVGAGEVVALLGENGAGKTTLLRVVSGFLRPDAGDVLVDGAAVRLRGPRDAAHLGIGMVHQSFLLIPDLTVAENVVLGREPGRGPLLDRRAAEAEVHACAARFGLDVDPRAVVRDLGVAARQRVELLKVLVRGARFLLLDEPTGLLPPDGIRDLFALVQRLAREGCGVVLVTHRLHEVFAVCGRAAVLRRGRVTGERDVASTDESELARLMVGEDAGTAPAAGRGGAPGDVLLRADDVTVEGRGGRPAVDRASLVVRAGEIVGLAGVAGSGQTELLEALAAVRPAASGRVVLAGVDLSSRDVAARRAAGLAYVPEDRVHDGLAQDLSVAENLVLGASADRGFFARGWMVRERVRAEGSAAVGAYDVRPPDPELPCGALSGGNQQKVLLARELRTRPRVLLAGEPARGLDFLATAAVHARLRELAAAGGGVLFAGTDLTELLQVCDRILVMFGGRIAGEVRPGAGAEERIGLLMARGSDAS